MSSFDAAARRTMIEAIAEEARSRYHCAQCNAGTPCHSVTYNAEHAVDALEAAGFVVVPADNDDASWVQVGWWDDNDAYFMHGVRRADIPAGFVPVFRRGDKNGGDE